MAYQLVWTAEAENDFKNIIVYLKENWSIQSAQKFTIRTYKEFEKLLAMPPIARPTSQQAFFYTGWIVKMHYSFLWKGIILFC